MSDQNENELIGWGDEQGEWASTDNVFLSDESRVTQEKNLVHSLVAIRIKQKKR